MVEVVDLAVHQRRFFEGHMCESLKYIRYGEEQCLVKEWAVMLR